jgi:N-acyl-L-homoserine lactone synthetase
MGRRIWHMLNQVRSIPAVIVRGGQDSEVSSFARSVLNLLERVEYRLCDGGEDLEAIYRLRYESYLRVGMLKPNAAHMVTDSYDDLPNSYRFGVFYDGHLVSTIRLHAVNAMNPLSPSTEVFGDVLMPRIAAGETFVDPSRFAADPEWSSSLRVLPYITLRLAVVACEHFRPSYCLTAIKEEHTGFYQRIFRSVEAVPTRTYPGLTVPVYLYQSKCAVNLQSTIDRFPFFKSTAFERRLLFQRPKRGELAPLTVLPTAKYSLAAA